MSIGNFLRSASFNQIGKFSGEPIWKKSICPSHRQRKWELERDWLGTEYFRPESATQNDDLNQSWNVRGGSACRDRLTGMANRKMLAIRMAIASSRRIGWKSSSALFFLNLDEFKKINDVHGHHVGDVILKQVANRFHSVASPKNLLARLDADKFALFVEDMGSSQKINALSRALIQSLNHPLSYFNFQFLLKVSIGVSRGMGIWHPEEVIVSASEACGFAKRQGGNCCCVAGSNEE